jgi:diacylglycerol kinase (ATP)
MRFHVFAAAVVLVVSAVVGASRMEVAVLVLVMMVVFVTEMLNTALEFAVDLVTQEYRPLAKLSKDVSAGAVLVSSAGAVVVGALILLDDLVSLLSGSLGAVQRAPLSLTLGALGTVALISLLGKAAFASRHPFGAPPSVHAAVASAGCVAVSSVAAQGRHGGVVFVLSLLMALLVCQSRVESGAQNLYGVAIGAAIGALVTVALFQLL